MPKKSFRKKKRQQAAEQAKAKDGLINNYDGNYIPEGRAANNAMTRDYFYGYKVRG